MTLPVVQDDTRAGARKTLALTVVLSDDSDQDTDTAVELVRSYLRLLINNDHRRALKLEDLWLTAEVEHADRFNEEGP